MTGDNRNDDSKGRKGLSYQESWSEADQELLNACFDGESLNNEDPLKERLWAIKSRLEGGDPSVAAHYEELQFLRESIRAWVDEQYKFADGSERKVDLWQGIQSRISEAEVEGAAQAKGPFAELPSIPWWREAGEQLSQLLSLLRPTGLSGAIVTAVLIGALATMLFETKSAEQGDESALVLASGTAPGRSVGAERAGVAEPTFSPAAPETSFTSGELHFAGNRAADEPGLPLIGMIDGERFLDDRHLVVTSPYSRNSRLDSRFKRPLRMHLETSQLITRSGGASTSTPRSLRTDKLDIDWIKSSRPFKIVPAHGRQAPPVIWVANSGR